MLNLLTIILTTSLVTVFGLSAVSLYRYTEHNHLQRTLFWVLIIWLAMFIGLEIDLLRGFGTRDHATTGVLNFHAIVMGLIGLFSLLTYPVTAIHPRLMSVRNSLLFLSPVLVSLLFYLVWHLVVGLPMNRIYHSLGELWAERYTVTVALRLLMIGCFAAYLFIMLRNVWMLVPIYERYSEGIYSDVSYNVRWLRLVVAATGCICLAYLLLITWKHCLSELIYAVVTCGFFLKIVDNAIFHKVFHEPPGMEVKWSWRKGWHEVLQATTPIMEDRMEGSFLLVSIDRWMATDMPYVDPEFSLTDLTGHFPSVDFHKLSDVLAARGENFQSYVRRIRIQEACRRIETTPQLKIKEISLGVGFTSQPAFTRAFVAVMGEPPSEYRKKIESGI